MRFFVPLFNCEKIHCFGWGMTGNSLGIPNIIKTKGKNNTPCGSLCNGKFESMSSEVFDNLIKMSEFALNQLEFKSSQLEFQSTKKLANC